MCSPYGLCGANNKKGGRVLMCCPWLGACVSHACVSHPLRVCPSPLLLCCAPVPAAAAVLCACGMSCRQRLPVDVAVALVKAGAPLDAGDSNGNTALHYSLERENLKVCVQQQQQQWQHTS